MQERASQQPVRGARMRWALSRGLLLLGGVVAGTAAAWALSGATASADTLSHSTHSPALPGTDHHAVHRVVDDATDAVGSVADPRHDAEKLGDAVRHTGDTMKRAGGHVSDTATRVVDTTVEGVKTTVDDTVSTMQDPRAAARDAAESAANGAEHAFDHFRSGWKHFAGKVAPKVPDSPVIDGVSGMAAPSWPGHTTQYPGADSGADTPTTPEPAQAAQQAPASAPVSAPEHHGAPVHHADSQRSDVPAHSTGDRGHDQPCAPAHHPAAPAVVPAGTGTGGQCTSGGGTNGVAAAIPGDVIEPGNLIGRRALLGARTPGGQPGRQPGSTPD